MPADPRLLFPILDILEAGVREWTRAFSTAAEEALLAAARIDGAAGDLRRAAVAFEADARETLRIADVALADARRAVAETTSAHHLAERTERSGHEVMHRVNAAAMAWQSKRWAAESELADARNEEARARAEEASAHDELYHARREEAAAHEEVNAAQEDVRMAQNRLADAEAALSRCQNSYHTNDKGERVYQDCSSEARQVSFAKFDLGSAFSALQVAQERLSAALAWVVRMESRVAAAVAWVQRAVARVARAERRVALCLAKLQTIAGLRYETDVQLSQVADVLRMANDAVATGEDARNWGQAGQDHGRRAVTHAEAAMAAAMAANLAALEVVAHAQAIRDAARRQVENCARSVYELADIVDALRQFDSAAGL